MYLGKDRKTPAQRLTKLLSESRTWKYKETKVLFYDIETAPLKAWIFRPGEQRISPKSLDKAHDNYHIISIQYCWNDGKPGKYLSWGLGHEVETEEMIKRFDAIVKSADLVIGKNNKRFDDKHVNAQRMLSQLPVEAPWLDATDDLERQFRKHFYMASQSLDYISGQLGLGGKVKMELQDWIDIVDWKKLKQLESVVGNKLIKDVSIIEFNRSYCEVNRAGKNAFEKMMKYGVKDVEDTRAVWAYAESYIKPKFNQAKFKSLGLACVNIGCGSQDLIKNGTRMSGTVLYQNFFCKKCNRYAGRSPVRGLLEDYKGIS